MNYILRYSAGVIAAFTLLAAVAWVCVPTNGEASPKVAEAPTIPTERIIQNIESSPTWSRLLAGKGLMCEASKEGTKITPIDMEHTFSFPNEAKVHITGKLVIDKADVDEVVKALQIIIEEYRPLTFDKVVSEAQKSEPVRMRERADALEKRASDYAWAVTVLSKWRKRAAELESK